MSKTSFGKSPLVATQRSSCGNTTILLWQHKLRWIKPEGEDRHLLVALGVRVRLRQPAPAMLFIDPAGPFIPGSENIGLVPGHHVSKQMRTYLNAGVTGRDHFEFEFEEEIGVRPFGDQPAVAAIAPRRWKQPMTYSMIQGVRKSSFCLFLPFGENEKRD